MRFQKVSIALAVIAALSACGGGGGTIATNAPVTTSFSGKVIDGYIKNAKVCLDLNSNLKCDDGDGEEEKAYTKRTGDGGSYSFSYTGVRDVASLHIIAEADAQSLDEDDAGLTFAQAGRNPVSLLTPASAPQTVSPLTTLVSNQQIVAKEEGKTLSVAEAESRVKVAANLPSAMALTGNDYKNIATGNSDTAVIAKAITFALADAQKIFNDDTSFNDGSAAAGKVAKVEAIRQSVASVQLELAKNVDGDGKLKVTATQFQTATTQVISGNIQDIVKVVSAAKSSVWDPATYIKTGMYFLQIASGEWFGDGKTPESAVRIDGPMPSFNGVKQSSDGTKFYDTDSNWALRPSKSQYEKTYKWPSNYYLSDSGWVKNTNETVSDVSRSENCFKIKSQTGTQEACGKSTDWSGKSVSEAGFCSTSTKNTFFKTCTKPDLKFPAGSISNDISLTSTTDDYSLWGVENGPGIIYTYTQVGTTITVIAPNHGLGNDWDVVLDFTTGTAKDGAYKVTASIDANTFTVTSDVSTTTSGNAMRYWGGGWMSGVNGQVVSLNNFLTKMSGANGYPIWMESCQVAGKLIVDADSPSGYSVNWSKGMQGANGCALDTLDSAKKYKQKTKLIIETVKGQEIIITTAPDIYKISNGDFYGIDLIWAVATNPAGIKGIYNGDVKRASVKREVISGTKEAIGNRAFVETINEAWGYSALPSDTLIFSIQ